MSKGNKSSILNKGFLKTRKGQMIFCGVGILISILFLASQMGSSFSGLVPSGASRESLERELKKLSADQEKLQKELAEITLVRQQAQEKLQGAWQVAVHGEPEVELRTMIENAAKKLDMRLNNISTVRRSAFNKDISLLEVDINLTADLDLMIKFLQEMEALTPKLYWKRFDCRSTYMYGMSVMQFNGTLRCANDERPEAITPRVKEKTEGSEPVKTAEQPAASQSENTPAPGTAESAKSAEKPVAAQVENTAAAAKPAEKPADKPAAEGGEKK